MKKIKDILKSVWNLYGYLSILIHEFSHIIAMILVNSGIDKINIKMHENMNIECLISTKREISKRKVFIVAFAPFAAVALIGVLAIFSKVCLVFFVYELTNFVPGRTLPSEVDVVAYYKVRYAEKEDMFDSINVSNFK